MNNSLRCLKMTIVLVAFSAALVAATPAVARVIIYPAPQGEPLSRDYALEVNGEQVPIYLAKLADMQDPPDWAIKPGQLGGPYSFAYFDFTGSVTVKITSLKKPLDKLVIRPLSAGIVPVIEGNTVTFTLDEPQKLSFEPEGVREPLLMFANPPEVDAPQEGDPGVIYFGPGIHKPTRITVSDGQTLYLTGGAIVKGGVAVSGRDVKIRGRGILCGNDWAWRQGPGRMLGISDAVNVLVEGIILRGAWGWTIPIYNSDSVDIINVNPPPPGPNRPPTRNQISYQYEGNKARGCARRAFSPPPVQRHDPPKSPGPEIAEDRDRPQLPWPTALAAGSFSRKLSAAFCARRGHRVESSGERGGR